MDERPSSKEYQDYEVPLEARNNLKEVEICLKRGMYDSEQMVREHLDLLEDLNTDITNALETEKKIGRYNATASTDQQKVMKLIRELETKLREFEGI